MLRDGLPLAVAAVLLFGACQGERRAEPVSANRERTVDNAVARVGGEPIGASDVSARMREDGIGREAALAGLVDEMLLVGEAKRRGLAESATDQQAIERVMVRAMLRDIEAELTPQSISDREVREDFEAHREKLQVPEQRRSWHILVKDSTDEGRSLAESILDEVHRARDPDAIYRRYAEGETEGKIEIRAEKLPPMPPQANIETPYKNAMFEPKTSGPLKKVVQTSHGWHVIVVTEIIAGETRTLAEVEDEIRQRLSQKKRFERIVSIVRALQSEGLVEYDDEGVDRLLSMSGLPKRGD